MVEFSKNGINKFVKDCFAYTTAGPVEECNYSLACSINKETKVYELHLRIKCLNDQDCFQSADHCRSVSTSKGGGRVDGNISVPFSL